MAPCTHYPEGRQADAIVTALYSALELPVLKGSDLTVVGPLLADKMKSF